MPYRHNKKIKKHSSYQENGIFTETITLYFPPPKDNAIYDS